MSVVVGNEPFISTVFALGSLTKVSTNKLVYTFMYSDAGDISYQTEMELVTYKDK